MNKREKTVLLPLTSLIAILEGDGFRISIDQRVKLQVILNSFQKEILSGNLEDLKYYIRPLIVKSQNQQSQFDHSFEKYTQYIKSKSEVQKSELEEKKQYYQSDFRKKQNFQKHKNPIILLIGLIGFLSFSYILNEYREPPSINSLSLDKKWVSVGDSITIQGIFNGMFMEASISIDDSRSFISREYSAKNDTISFTKKISKSDSVKAKFEVRNLLTSKISKDSLYFKVCQDKPIISIDTKIDPTNSLLVDFSSNIESDTSREISVSWKLDSTEISIAEKFTHDFRTSGTYSIELLVSYTNAQSSICNYTQITKSITLNSIILGEKKQLIGTHQTSGLSDGSGLISPGNLNTAYFNIFDPGSWQGHDLKEILLLLLAIIICALLPIALIEVFIFRRRKIIPSPEIASSLKFDGINPPYDLEFPDQNAVIEPERELFALSRMMKHRTEAGILRFDVVKSIKGTTLNSGFIKLFYKEITKVPEYLVIVDRSAAEGFHVNLFRYLNDFLSNEDTLLEVFYFNNNPRYLNNSTYPDGISLNGLYEKYPDHILMVFSEGDKLINLKLDRLFQWSLDELPKWPKRFLLTMRNFSDWGLKEELIDPCIPVLPATLKGMLYMSESLSLSHLPDLKNRIKELKLSGDISFNQVDSITGIKVFLQEPILIQWFSCLALYPKLHWQFVISIGKALAESYKTTDQDFKVNYESLYKIAEVSHLLANEINDDLRIELMKQIDPEAEKIARKAILDLLSEMKVPEDSYAYREMMVQTKINHLLLNRDDKQAKKDLFFLWENNYVEDGPIKTYLRNEKDTLLEKKADQYFRPVNYQDKKNFYWRLVGYFVVFFFVLFIFNITLFQQLLPKEMSNPELLVSPVKEASIEESINQKIITFNHAMDSYGSQDFLTAIDTLSELELDLIPRDSLQLDVLHYIGLSHYYLNNIDSAKTYLDRLNSIDSTFLSKYYPNLETLLGVGGKTENLNPKQQNLNRVDTISNSKVINPTKISINDALVLQIFQGHNSFVNSVAFSPDGNAILTGSQDGTAVLWDTNGNRAQTFIGHQNVVTSLAFSPYGNTFITGSFDITAILWDTRGKQIQKFSGHEDFVESVAISPDGTTVLTGSGDSTAILWDMKGNVIQKFKRHQSDVLSVAFSPDGNAILTGSRDRTAILWDTRGNVIQKFEGHTHAVTSLAFSPSGNTVLTGSADRTAILWNTKGNVIQKFEGHTDAVSSVAFFPDGNAILTGSLDNTAILWDMKGNVIQKFEGHTNAVSSVAFSPDGKTIITGSLDKTARLWQIEK